MTIEKQGQGDVQEYFVDAIENITFSPLLGSRTYWTIVFSNCAIYFCKTGTNSMPLFGPLGIVMHVYNKTKSNKKDLSEILGKSKKYYQFTKESSASLKVEKKSSGGKVTFPIENGKEKELKLGNKQFESFTNNLETISS